jgi:hypothetical protein
MPEVKTTCEIKGNTVTLISDPVGSPNVDRSPDACAVYDNFLMEGAYCYQVCGHLPPGKEPGRIEFYTRIAHQGDSEPWVECSGDGCETYAESFDRDSGQLCAYFKLWKGRGEHRDLMVKVALA